MLVVSYSPLLVLTSVVVAVMAAFTALRLTSGLSRRPPAARRPVIARAAVALGGGIWAMHFVGMLSMQMPVPVRYDLLPTLISALFAILVVGVGFIVLHFGARNWQRIALGGALMGAGIVGMHYLGMSAVSGGSVAVHAPFGIVVASAVGLAASVFGLWLAYRERSLRTTVIGAIALGLAVSAMHYSAMGFTSFVPVENTRFAVDAAITSETLAMLVSVAAFVICGLFLLLAIPVDEASTQAVETGADEAACPASDVAARHRRVGVGPDGQTGDESAVPDSMIDGASTPGIGEEPVARDTDRAEPTPEPEITPVAQSSEHVDGDASALGRVSTDAASRSPSFAAESGTRTRRAGDSQAVLSRAFADEPVRAAPARLPYERNQTIRFVPEAYVLAVRADGHYTWLITASGELFCPWAISRVEASVSKQSFLRTHRSHLVRIESVVGFRREGDRAVCLIGESDEVAVPVSRTRVGAVRAALGMGAAS